jgi:zinc transport system permease protein
VLDLLHYDFMRNAIAAALLVSVACGIVGTLVVVKRIVFVSGGVSHAAFGGIGLGYWLGINPLITVIPFSLIAALGLGLVARATRVSEDSAIGILWTIGMAVGIVFVQLTPGYAPDLMSYLFGNILTVPRADLVLMLALDGVILLITLLFHREFVAVAFDEEFAAVVGVPTRAANALLLCLVALSVVVLIRVVGVILVIALLTLPASIARQFTHNLGRLMAAACAVGAILTCAGLWLSYALDLSSGATIILVMSAVFLVTSGATRPRPARRTAGDAR